MTTLTAKTTDNQLSNSPGNQQPREKVSLNCDKHGQYLGFSEYNELVNRTFKSQCPICIEEKKAAEEKSVQKAAAEKKLLKVRELLRSASIPPRFLSRSFDNFRADNEGKAAALKKCKGMADNFDYCLQHGTSLLMCGKPGTGKSHLAAAFAVHIMNQGRSAVYTSVLKAVRAIKDTYRKDSEVHEQQAINALISPDLLILDEVGVQFGSETEKMYLFEILNGRYEHVKPTIVISNLTPDEVKAYLGDRVIDRLSEGGGGMLAFDWESYRSKVITDKELPSVEPKPVDWNRYIEGRKAVG
jgi:DNA replication protein DnaC